MRRLFVTVGPDGFVTACALVATFALVALAGGRVELRADGIAPLVLLALLLSATGLVRLPLLFEPANRRRFLDEQLSAARAWAPFIVAYVCYRVVVASVNGVTGAGVEDQLKALDEALLGVSPSWWLQGWVSPWFTELMSFAYGLMFVLPLGVLLLLHGRGRGAEFRVVALAVLCAFYLGLVGYLLVPARSPRLVYEYPIALHGAFGLYEASSRAWDQLQAVTYDAFPSLHTAVSTLSLIYAWRVGDALSSRRPRLLFWIYLPNVLLLQLSTLYLRQHYFVDVVAGWSLAVLVVWLAPRLVLVWARLGHRIAHRART